MVRKIHQFDNGIKVYDDHLIDAQRERYRHNNIHEPEEEEIFRRLLEEIPADGCFLNIGAAIGYYALLAKKLAPDLEIHAVEPLLRHREFFLENIALNDLDKTGFVIHMEGISTREGQTDLIDHGYGSSLARPGGGLPGQVRSASLKSRYKTLRRKIWPRRSEVTQTVVTVTLEKMIAVIGRPVDLCQMDIQGFERDVLKSSETLLRKDHIINFLIGTHSQEVHEGCVKILQSSGYRILHDNYETADQPDGILVARKAD